MFGNIIIPCQTQFMLDQLADLQNKVHKSGVMARVTHFMFSSNANWKEFWVQEHMLLEANRGLTIKVLCQLVISKLASYFMRG